MPACHTPSGRYLLNLCDVAAACPEDFSWEAGETFNPDAPVRPHVTVEQRTQAIAVCLTAIGLAKAKASGKTRIANVSYVQRRRYREACEMSTEEGPDDYIESSENVSMGDRPAGERIDNREFRRNRHRECYCRGRNKNCPKCQGTGQLLPNWRENLQAARQTRPASDRPSLDRATSDRVASDRSASDRSGSDRQSSDRSMPTGSSMNSSSAVSSPVPSREYRSDDRGDRSPDRGSDRSNDRGGDRDRPDRGQDRGYNDRSDRGGGGGGGGGGYGRRDRWQSRRDGGGGGGGGRKNQSNRVVGKVCPMCGEFVPNLRAHVLARHDD